MDPFSRLPFHALLSIAKSAPDLASLHSLRCASPAVADLFRDSRLAAEIMEPVLTNSLAPAVCALVRALCSVLWHPPRSMFEVMQTSPMRREVAEVPLPLNVPGQHLMRLLALATVVRAAACRCAGTLFFRSLATPPQRPNARHLDARRKSFRYTPYRPHHKEPVKALVGESNADADAAVANQPLSWVEEQRILFGMWQLALILVISHIIRSNPAVRANPRNNVKLCDPLRMWWDLKGPVPYHSYYLQTVLDMPHEGFDFELVGQGPVPSSMPRLASLYSPAPALLSGPCTCLGRPPLESWSPAQHSPGYQRYSEFTTLPGSPLRAAPAAPFARLGFLVWDRWRLEAMGFLSSYATVQQRFNGEEHAATYSDAYSWYFVLSPSQVRRIQKRQKGIRQAERATHGPLRGNAF